MFDFNALCARPVAAADYIALAEAFSTVALSGVPLFGAANLAAAYRFVTLIDVLYEHRWVCWVAGWLGWPVGQDPLVLDRTC
jgi:predicted ATPase